MARSRCRRSQRMSNPSVCVSAARPSEWAACFIAGCGQPWWIAAPDVLPLNHSGDAPQVLVTPTPDLGKVLNAMQELRIEGDINLATAVQVGLQGGWAVLQAQHMVMRNERRRVVQACAQRSTVASTFCVHHVRFPANSPFFLPIAIRAADCAAGTEAPAEQEPAAAHRHLHRQPDPGGQGGPGAIC